MSINYTEEKTYEATRIPVGRARTLIPEAYRSPDFYSLEQERIFSQSWVFVGYTSQAKDPGSTFLAEVAGQPFFIIRNSENQLRCFYNVCRHRGSQLVTKEGKYSAI